MIRRSYLGLVASFVPGAVVVSGALAAAEDSVESKGSDVAILEPLSITVDASRERRAREWLWRVQRGSLDRAQLDPEFSTLFTSDDVAGGVKYASGLGAPLDMRPFEKRVTAEGVADMYRVRFASKTLTWIYKTGPRGINGLTLRHSTHDIVFQVISFSLEGY